MNPAGEWCLIESDPGVFTHLIKSFGVQGLQVEEMLTIEKEDLQSFQPIYGLIFLFKCIDNKKSEGSLVTDSRMESIFFAKQVISNACATQAIINMLLNVNDENISLGDNLTEFKTFTQSFDPEMKGSCLSNSEPIKKVHNSFARQQVYEIDQPKVGSEDNYHFIAYMPIGDRLYELDGLKEGPIDHGKIENSTHWTNLVSEVIKKRISHYKITEINFNLMAVVADQKLLIENKIDSLNKQVEQLDRDDGTDKHLRMEIVKSEIEAENVKLSQEVCKRQQYEVENMRRRHNYLPFIVEIIKILAEKQQLVGLVQEQKSKTTSQNEKTC